MLCDARQNAELGARVKTDTTRRWIRLRIPKLLRVGQNRRVVGTRLHAAEDVVARTVDDAAEPRHLIAPKPLQHARNHWHSARNGGPMHQMNIVLCCEPGETRTTIGD